MASGTAGLTRRREAVRWRDTERTDVGRSGSERSSRRNWEGVRKGGDKVGGKRRDGRGEEKLRESEGDRERDPGKGR